MHHAGLLRRAGLLQERLVLLRMCGRTQRPLARWRLQRQLLQTPLGLLELLHASHLHLLSLLVELDNGLTDTSPQLLFGGQVERCQRKADQEEILGGVVRPSGAGHAAPTVLSGPQRGIQLGVLHRHRPEQAETLSRPALVPHVVFARRPRELVCAQELHSLRAEDADAVELALLQQHQTEPRIVCRGADQATRHGIDASATCQDGARIPNNPLVRSHIRFVQTLQLVLNVLNRFPLLPILLVAGFFPAGVLLFLLRIRVLRRGAALLAGVAARPRIAIWRLLAVLRLLAVRAHGGLLLLLGLALGGPLLGRSDLDLLVHAGDATPLLGRHLERGVHHAQGLQHAPVQERVEALPGGDLHHPPHDVVAVAVEPLGARLRPKRHLREFVAPVLQGGDRARVTGRGAPEPRPFDEGDEPLLRLPVGVVAEHRAVAEAGGVRQEVQHCDGSLQGLQLAALDANLQIRE
mmetsp:Transcript_14227/g.42332  ORF Transcript_14227/g.42332 Transcript_14227/m.42332 type:complete len:465 (-) Transcript_14227:188-1582(-)